MSEYTDDAMGWRTSILNAIQAVRDAFDQLGEATIDELDSANDLLEGEIEDLAGSLPCEDGMLEFINNLEGDHDGCYDIDSVAITVDDLHNGDHGAQNWGIEAEHQVVTFRDLASVLEQLLDDTRIRRTRIALQGLILRLNHESFRSSNDTDEFLQTYLDMS